MEIIEKKMFEMTKDNKIIGTLIADSPEHREMLTHIAENLPEINRGISLFGKSQSQFMDNQLTVSHLTPYRNLKQILAEVNKTAKAYRDADISCRKKQVEIEILNRDYDKEEDNLKKELIGLEIEAKCNQLYEIKNYVSGSIRKLTNYMDQYNSIKESYDIGEFTEADIEDEEESFHISKAFQQGLCAARASGGIVDHGNQIYFEQIGINGAVAGGLVVGYLIKEEQLGKSGEEPTYEMYLKFIDDMKEKFKGCSKISAQYKGMAGPSKLAFLK